MSRQEDILFCKIAVANGLVTRENAQKCLAYCDRREQDGGRRPMVGAVFTKHNLLRSAEVQRIYTAVNKRLGRPATGLAVGSVTRTAGKGKVPHASGLIAERGRRKARRVDPQTLWLGIGFGTIFLGVIVTMIVLWITNRQPGPEGAASGPATATAGGGTGPGSGILDAGGSSPGAASGGATGTETGSAPKPAAEMDPAFLGELQDRMNDARRMGLIEENPTRALQMFQAFVAGAKKRGHYINPERQQQIDALVEELQDLASESGGAEGGGLNGDLGES